jgi:hypothetical protein
MTIEEKKTKQVERDIPILALEQSIKIQEKNFALAFFFLV